MIPKTLEIELQPLYSTFEPNADVSLYKGLIELRQHNCNVSGSGDIRLVWLPSPRFLFRVSTDSIRSAVDLDKAEIICGELGQSFGVQVNSINYPGTSDRPDRMEVGGELDDTESGHEQSLTSAMFHLMNFIDFLGRGVRDEQCKHSRAARAHLEAGGWTIHLDTLRDFKNLNDGLKAKGGYAITHVGRFQRSDSQPFSTDEAKDMIETLYHFLSFCRGRWVAPFLPIGFDSTGKQVWWQWRGWKSKPHANVGGWFDWLARDYLCSVFPGFLKKWNSSTWREPICHSLHWYIEANTCAGGVEGAIILCQAAFELLSWTLLVEETRSMSVAQFEDLEAKDKLRALLKECQIPRDIPSTLTDLVTLANSQNWSDGPSAIVGIRNALVHPKPNKRKKVFAARVDARGEAWFLALWYLDLILLKLFDHSGTYINRLRGGYRHESSEIVPWATVTT